MITAKQVLIDRLRGKASKESVNYRPSRGADTIDMCQECSYFDGNDACTRVAGVIEGEDVCDIYMQKVGTSQPTGSQITINISPGPIKVQTESNK